MKKINFCFFTVPCFLTVILLFPNLIIAENKDQERDILFLGKYSKDEIHQITETRNSIKKVEGADIIPSFSDDISSENINKYDSIAVSYEVVKNNKSLSKKLKENLENGKKVYLYGDLTFEDYSKVLEVDISLDTKTRNNEVKKLVFGNNNNNGNDSKTLEIEAIDKLQIIGYSLNKEDNIKVLGLNISHHDENGKTEIIPDSLYLKGILRYEQKDIENDSVTLNNVPGEPVLRNDVLLVGEAFYITDIVGEIQSNWYLYKLLDEQDPDWDYFLLDNAVKPKIMKHNGSFFGSTWRATFMRINHILPSHLKSRLIESTPKDTEGDDYGNYSLSISFPWQISFTIPYRSKPTIQLDEDLKLNQSDWYVEAQMFGKYRGLESSREQYRFITAWTAGTDHPVGNNITEMIVRNYVEFTSGIDASTDTGNQFLVRYRH
ncbi:hypothetical protein JOC94_003137 [Bacillus thermophilus]|uniref:Uncharacterized protein n=1 Tax=Siminovitchia thermophila TaxID=1245522 RepID=A0ABS2R901_9BACI|nr:hypothetical protein [Siminovitchia thermophila]MBM7716126.1 hypothetical protein [Siminovitchia thermophila]ONK22425.1 hypothetical protein BLX87_16210 [Bacillus sp. VT-16-64]